VADAALMMIVLAQARRARLDLAAARWRDYRVGLDDGVRGLRIAFSPTLGYAKDVHAKSQPRWPPRCANSRRWARRSEAVDPGINLTRWRSLPACGSWRADPLERPEPRAAGAGGSGLSVPRPSSARG